MSGIETIREWLERNKIFFEIIVALSLTIMSMIVSLNANQIAANQNNIMKEENQPIFTFDNNIYSNDTSNVAEGIDIDNVGKPAYNFSVKPYVLFDIKEIDNNGNVKSNAIIPILDFYNGGNFATSSTGHIKYIYRQMSHNQVENRSDIYVFEAINNTDEVLLKIEENLNYFQNGNPNDDTNNNINVDLCTYFDLTFDDIYGDRHNEMYYVDVFGQSFKLSEYDRIHLEREYNKQIMQKNYIYDVMYIPPNEIIKRLSNYSSSNYILPSYIAYSGLPPIWDTNL